jgi:hypothetical protein
MGTIRKVISGEVGAAVDRGGALHVRWGKIGDVGSSDIR